MLLSPDCHKVSLSWTYHQTGKNCRWSVLLRSTAAFLPGAGSLNTQTSALLEATQITSWGRKWASTNRGQGYRTPGRLADWWNAKKSHFLRLNKIIRSQYLQGVLYWWFLSLTIATTSKKKEPKMATWLAGNVWQINMKKAFPSSNLMLCPSNHTSLFLNMSLLYGLKFFSWKHGMVYLLTEECLQISILSSQIFSCESYKKYFLITKLEWPNEIGGCREFSMLIIESLLQDSNSPLQRKQNQDQTKS